MTRSMTAFAGADREIPGWLFSWEVRSVNHRFLDISLRLPDAFRCLEPEVRRSIGNSIKRGRVDCTLTVKKTEQGQAAIRINRALAAQLIGEARQIEALGGSPWAPFNAFQVLQWPGVLHEPEIDREALAVPILEVLDEALHQMVIRREAEGRQLALLVEERCIRIKEYAAAAGARLPEILAAARAKVINRLAEIATSPDSERLEQEMVYLAQKLDIAEEIDRLSTHADEFLRALTQDEPMGRRLDFLLQELHREANTLGSKSADVDTTRIALEMKVLIEQIREQIQNIE